MNDPKDAKPLYNTKGESRVVYTEQEEVKARAEGFTLVHADLSAELKEYPKSLHPGGDRTQKERVVRNADDERAARADGFAMIDKERDTAAVRALGLDTKPEPVESKTKKK